MGARRMSGPYSFRAARGSDVSTLVAHRHRMFSDLGGRSEAAIQRHDRRYRAWVRTRLARGAVVGVIAEDRQGKPVASGCVWFRDEQPRPETTRLRSAYILSMYTAPSARRHGLARAIVRRLVAVVRRRGYGRVGLHASRFGRSIYEAEGFEPTNDMRLVFRGAAFRASVARARKPPLRRASDQARPRPRRGRAPARSLGRTSRAGGASSSGRPVPGHRRRTEG